MERWDGSIKCWKCGEIYCTSAPSDSPIWNIHTVDVCWSWQVKHCILFFWKYPAERFAQSDLRIRSVANNSGSCHVCWRLLGLPGTSLSKRPMIRVSYSGATNPTVLCAWYIHSVSKKDLSHSLSQPAWVWSCMNQFANDETFSSGNISCSILYSYENPIQKL